MKRNSKGMLSIFVMAILALSFVMPLVSVLAIDPPVLVDTSPYYVGETLSLSGAPGQVTSGSPVNIYWDIASGPDAWLLNTTTGNPDGSYDVEIDIPDTLNGSHWIWVKDVATSDTNGDLTLDVDAEVDTDISRGLPDDDLEVTGTAFGDEQPVNISMYQATGGVWVFTDQVIDPGDSIDTNEYGTFVAPFVIPSALAYGTYKFNATDGWNVAEVNFTVGAAITLTPDEGPEGTVIEVSGRGFDNSVTLSLGNVTWDGTYSMAIDGDTATTTSNGEFTLEVVAPSWGEGSWAINVSSGTWWAEEDFEIDGVATVEVSPTYGSPGATVTVKGYNFTRIAGTEVALTMTSTPVSNLVTVETEADGTFETTFVSPAVSFETYKVWANDTVYDVNASDTFKVGIIAFIINPTFGESGTNVGVTGIGFSDGTYNLTFGDELYEDHGTVSGEAISDPFYVPNVEPGTYDLTVIDTEENELSVQFTVTESTYVIMDPALAPNEYNVTIEGYNFAEVVGAVDFVIYNSTDEWAMDVYEDGLGTVPVATDIDGNFTGWWMVFDEVDLSLGCYTVNVTDSEGIFVQLIPFCVVEARVDVAPRKALFDRGDAIQFDINNDFKLPDAYIEIYSPGDILYWSTEPFDTLWWMKVAGLYTVPYYRQTDPVGNSMELQSDAPMGTWLYIFYDVDDTELMNGTFLVGPSTTAQIDVRLSSVEGSLADLANDIAGVTTELGDDINALSGELDDVIADVQDMVDGITADLAGELAQVAADTEAAVGELEDSIGDIASAQNELSSELEAVSQDTTAAREAAEDAQTAASGLTTLVYGAIGASLIAALAAIVSLMQISKKIA